MHNVKIDYYGKENVKLGTHSFYPVPIPNGTYGFQQICELAAKNTTIEAHTIADAVKEYMKVVREKLCDGFRAEIGEKFVTLGPNLKGSVKDELNQDGTVKRAVTLKDLTANKCKSRVSAIVNPQFSDEFERSVSWRKTDKHGTPIEDEEDATETNEEADQNGSTGSGSDQPAGGSGDNGGGSGGENEDGE
jgi:hypothetical protein